MNNLATDENSGIKIGEILRQTGVTRATVHHYVREGLLPPPQKLSRNQALYEQDCVDRVLLPARFMVPWFEELGLDGERLHVETTGVDWEGAARHPRVERAPGAPVRVLFLGSLVPHKAPHLLLEAWGQLPDPVRAGASLRILGPDQHQPGYVEGLRAAAEPLGVTVGGALGREEVPVGGEVIATRGASSAVNTDATEFVGSSSTTLA